jgi:SAM-dependent methyltransferase
MKSFSPLKGVGVAGLLMAALAFGQPDLDVPYVPTPQEVVDEMLRMAQVGPGDTVYDLGCGDGRIVITAISKFNATKGVGVDLDPQRIKESNENAQKAGVTDRVTFRVQDLFTMSMEEADVLAMYLLPSVNLRLRPQIFEQMKPGSRIVSHDFDMGDWEPDEQKTVKSSFREHRIYLWIVPVMMQGTWNLAIEGETNPWTLNVQQRFQMANGTASQGETRAQISDFKIRGTDVSFNIEAGGRTTEFSGKVEDGKLTGTAKTGDQSRPFTATRA